MLIIIFGRISLAANLLFLSTSMITQNLILFPLRKALIKTWLLKIDMKFLNLKNQMTHSYEMKPNFKNV